MLPANPRTVITGAGGGLGQAFCRQLALRGARVLASDRTLAAAQLGAAAAGAGAHAFAADVTRGAEVEALAAEAERVLGGVDLFINNAGVAASGLSEALPIDDWRWLFEVNVFGMVNGLRAFVPRMRKQRSGHVINVASAAGLLSMPLMGAYNASKAAIVALSETLLAEVMGDGVGVTVACPMFFKTPLVEHGRGGPPWFGELIQKLMARDTLGADAVAAYALRSADQGELYSLPHPQSRFLWRMKRLLPEKVPAEARRGLFVLAKKNGLKAEL